MRRKVAGSRSSERLEPRCLLSTTPVTLVWTGGGLDGNWSTAANWNTNSAPTGDGSEQLVFPAGAQQMTSRDNLSAGSNTFAGINIAADGYSLLIDSPLELSQGGVTLSASGSALIGADSPTAELQISGTGFLSAAPNATLTVDVNLSVPLGTLTFYGRGDIAVNGVISGTGGLTDSNLGTVTLSGSNTYTGHTTILTGTMVAASDAALGDQSIVSVGSAGTLTLQQHTSPGLMGRYYYNLNARPDDFVDLNTVNASLGALTPVLVQNSATTSLNDSFDFGYDGSAFPAPFNANAINLDIVYTGLFNAPADGTYTFDTSSDDGSMLFIDGDTVVNNNAYQAVTTRSGTVDLSAGPHSITIAFWQSAATYGLSADVQIPGGALQRLPNSLLSTLDNHLHIGALSGAGTINLGSNELIVGTSNQNAIFSGTISGTDQSRLTKVGTGIQSIANPDYASRTTISSGALMFGDGVHAVNSFPTQPIEDSSRLILAVPSGTTSTFGSAVGGSGGIMFTGGGKVAVTNTNTYTGQTRILAGVVETANASALGLHSDVRIDAGATLNIPQVSTGLNGTYYSLTEGMPIPAQFTSISGIDSYVSTIPVLTKDISSAPNSANNQGATFDYAGDGSGFPQVVKDYPHNFNFIAVWKGEFSAPTAGDYYFDLGSDDGSVMYLDGQLVVDNNMGQALTVRGGSVNLSAGMHSIVIAYYQGYGPYGLFADVQLPGGALQRLPNSLLNSTKPLTIGTLSGGGTVHIASDNTLVLDSDRSAFFSGNITGGNLTKNGHGTQILSQPNYAGNSKIESGTLRWGDGVHPLTSLPPRTVANQGTLSLFLPAGDSVALHGGISGPGTFVVNGQGTLTIDAANSYTGSTVIYGGTVNASNSMALGLNSDLNVAKGATLNVMPNRAAGLTGIYYSTDPGMPDLNQLSSLAALDAYLSQFPTIAADSSATPGPSNQSGTVFDYGDDGAGLPAVIQDFPENFVGVWRGSFNAQVTGDYTFDTGSAGGSALFIDGQLVVNNLSNSQDVKVSSGTISLSAGMHSIVIAYAQVAGHHGLFADVTISGEPSERLPTALLSSAANVSIGTLTGAGSINVPVDQRLTIGATNLSASFSGSISGAGELDKVGTGNQILAHDNFPAVTSVIAGQLTVNGNLASQVNLLPEAQLSGSGAITNVAVAATSAADQFVVGAVGSTGRLSLTLNGALLGTFKPTQSLALAGLESADSIAINGTAGADHFVVNQDSITVNGAMVLTGVLAQRFVNGQAGNDVVRLKTSAAVQLNGGGGADQLIGPSAATTWNLAGFRSGTVGASAFTNFLDLAGGSAADTVWIGPTASGFRTIDGGGGDDLLIGPNLPDKWVLTGAAAGSTRTFQFMNFPSLRGGRDSDQFVIEAQATGFVSIQGGGGNDTLDAPDTSNLWTITSADSGQLNGLSFSAIGNLQGGAADDSFQFGAAGRLSGKIDGGQGVNQLDQRASTTGVTVDLRSGVGSGTAGVHHIQIVLGSLAGSNTLVGGSGGSILVASGGNNILRGGNNGRNLLIGGSGQAILAAGNSGDILVGGATAYDANVAALQAILAEWSDPNETYQERVDHLNGKTSGGLNGSSILAPATVTFSPNPTFVNGTGQDWVLS